jgi:ATP-dependent Zn protease
MSNRSIIVDRVESNIKDSASSFNDMMDIMKSNNSTIEKMSKEMSDYDKVLDSDTFYKNISDSISKMDVDVDVNKDSNVEDFSNSKNKYFPTWCVILILFLLFIGCIYFFKMKKEKNKLKSK